MKCTLATTLLLLGVCLPLSAAAKTIDLRKSSDPTDTAERRIGFCSRPSDSKTGFPGHAFVIFETQFPNKEPVIFSLGAMPSGDKEAARSIVTTVSGYLRDERMSVKNCLFLEVSREQYDAAFDATTIPYLKEIGIYNKDYISAEYKLLKKDCVSFVIKVARALEPSGLKVPSRRQNLTPKEFIDALKASN